MMVERPLCRGCGDYIDRSPDGEPRGFDEARIRIHRLCLAALEGGTVRVTTPGSPKRFEILGGPGGSLTCLPVGDGRRDDRFMGWVTLGRVNRSLTPSLSRAAKDWVLRTHRVLEVAR